jgi:hypothetical protein
MSIILKPYTYATPERERERERKRDREETERERETEREEESGLKESERERWIHPLQSMIMQSFLFEWYNYILFIVVSSH